MVNRAYDLYAPAYTDDLSVPMKGIQMMIDEDLRLGYLDKPVAAQEVVRDEILKRAKKELTLK
jgi:hypothetical protein